MPLPDGPVMATASPGPSAKLTSDRTVNGPRGVGYDLPTLETWSIGHQPICLEQALGRLLHVVVAPDPVERLLRKFAT